MLGSHPSEVNAAARDPPSSQEPESGEPFEHDQRVATFGSGFRGLCTPPIIVQPTHTAPTVTSTAVGAHLTP